MDAYWRAVNYLSVGPICLYDNPLLTRSLALSDVKHMLLGHWGNQGRAKAGSLSPVCDGSTREGVKMGKMSRVPRSRMPRRARVATNQRDEKRRTGLEDANMYKTILVAVDGSATSTAGLNEAITLATDQDATLYPLHVVEKFVPVQAPEVPLYVGELWEALRDSGKKILAGAVKICEEHGVRTRPVLVETIGHTVADAILEQAKKTHADLIVLGTHGRRGISRLVMGSDAEGVIRAATVPVLLVRTPRAAQPADDPGSQRGAKS
jgi:nucleotide-binding universal stress UspA family protein